GAAGSKRTCYPALNRACQTPAGWHAGWQAAPSPGRMPGGSHPPLAKDDPIAGERGSKTDETLSPGTCLTAKDNEPGLHEQAGLGPRVRIQRRVGRVGRWGRTVRGDLAWFLLAGKGCVVATPHARNRRPQARYQDARGIPVRPHGDSSRDRRRGRPDRWRLLL